MRLNKIFKQFDYYLTSKLYTLGYLVIMLIFYLIIKNIPSNNYFTEVVVYIKIFISLLVIYYNLYWRSTRFYEFSLFFSYFRFKISLYQYYKMLEYSIINGLFIFLLIEINAYTKITNYQLDINNLGQIIYYSLIINLFSSLIGLINMRRLGIMLIFLFNIGYLFYTLLANNTYFPNLFYQDTFYLNCDLIHLISYFGGCSICYLVVSSRQNRY